MVKTKKGAGGLNLDSFLHHVSSAFLYWVRVGWVLLEPMRYCVTLTFHILLRATKIYITFVALTILHWALPDLCTCIKIAFKFYWIDRLNTEMS